MLKVELHTHADGDPVDAIPHTPEDLIDRAAALGYDAIAMTLHEKQLDLTALAPYASARGIVLIPGVERTIEGRHVLLLNFRAGADELRTFEDLSRLRRRDNGLVIAPHPFFPLPSCLRGDLERHGELFDAVEVNAMFTPTIDFNRRAIRWAARHGKPLVGNCDVHRLWQLGTTYSLVDAAPDADSICEAVRVGRVEVVSRPVRWRDAAALMGSLILASRLHRPSDRDRAGAIDYAVRRIDPQRTLDAG